MMIIGWQQIFNWNTSNGRQNWMAYIHIKDYSKLKDYIHPNIKHTINHYKKVYYYILPTYHGCGLRNRSSIRKRVDYKRGIQCILPTQNPFDKKQVQTILFLQYKI